MYRTPCSSSSSYGDNQDHFNNPSLYISPNQLPAINGAHFSSNYINPSPHSYSSSFPANSYNSYLHRSDSSQSLPINHYMQELANKSSVFSSSSPSSSSGHEFLDLYPSGPMRRVFSTGDLQGMNGLQVSGENSNSNQEINGTGKAVRYSAEERKERIEKYRNKRNHRNFQKKITYACRKTLADSRPRVKGRFAKNGELETETETELDATTNNESFNYNNYNYNYNNYNNYNNNDNFNNGYNCNVNNSNQAEWWRQIEETLEAEDESESFYYDEQMLVLSDVLSMNLLS